VSRQLGERAGGVGRHLDQSRRDLFGGDGASGKIPAGASLAVALGWDWGGNLALALASSSTHAKRVRALALYAPSWTSPMASERYPC
jgi:pimeloyl-ACP methyl ester carboxylesterase